MKREKTSDTVQQIPQECIVRIPPWVWFLLSLLAGLGLHRIVPLGFMPPEAGSIFGWVIVGLGMAILALSERQFARHRTSHDNRGITSALITTGPFRLSRNPVYLGLMIMLVGLAVTFNVLWLLISMPLAFLVIQFHVVPKEEACLQQLFPNTYTGYQSSVRRWL